MKLPITAIILSFNEERNIANCIESINNWVDQIIVIDSFSTDGTKKICSNYNVNFIEREFANYSDQRNWALKLPDIKNDWVLNLDADHQISKELKKSLHSLFSQRSNYDSLSGVLVSRRTIFMDKWIRFGGHYPTYHCILFKKEYGKCEEKLYDQHFLVSGKLNKIKGDIIDVFSENINDFIIKHLKWAELEASYQLSSNNSNEIVKADLFGNPIQKRRKLKNYYEKLPLFIRPLIYFIIRYVFRLGFLDGRVGLIFHFLQGFWFRFMVDVKIFESKFIKHKNEY